MARQTQTIYLKGIPAIRARIKTRQRMGFPKLKAFPKRNIEEETKEILKKIEEESREEASDTEDKA